MVFIKVCSFNKIKHERFVKMYSKINFKKKELSEIDAIMKDRNRRFFHNYTSAKEQITAIKNRFGISKKAASKIRDGETRIIQHLNEINLKPNVKYEMDKAGRVVQSTYIRPCDSFSRSID